MQHEEDVRNAPYFFCNFKDPTEVAEFLKLKSGSKVGSFLVRPSFRAPQNLTVSVVCKDKSVRHTNIIVENYGHGKEFYLVREKKFHSLQSLLDHYRNNDVKNLEKVSHVRFMHPILRNARRQMSDQYSSSSSTSSNHQPSGSYNDLEGEQERPPLPERPKLPRRPSGSTSSSSVFEGSIGQSSVSRSSFEHKGAPLQSSNLFDDQCSMINSNSQFKSNQSFHSNQSIDRRPPAPLPLSHEFRDGNPYYSSPRNVDEDISEKLKEVLKQNERCDCGIPRDMSDLPLGWTVHRSKDVGTFGRLFFQSADGVTTWKIPVDVQSQMNTKQKQNISTLLQHYTNEKESASSSGNSYLGAARSQHSDTMFTTEDYRNGAMGRQPNGKAIGRQLTNGDDFNTRF